LFKEVNMPPRISTSNAPCAICKYPAPAPSHVGQQVKCAYCGSINEAITDVTIPTPVFVGFLAFAAGVFFGPAILAATDVGSDYLARQIRGRHG